MKVLELKMNGALCVDRFSNISKLIAFTVGIGALTASSYIEVPMYPVPMTMQTTVVLLIGALYGFRFGLITVGAWLGLAFLGAPLLAGGMGGIVKFTGTTAGYLFGFLVATSFVGWLSDRGWNGKKPVLAFVAMLIGEAIIFALGWIWLSIIIGAEKAWLAGVAPFLLGDLFKTILAVLILIGVHREFTAKFLK